ncbi:chloride channel protein [Pseudolysobacter antarcticus]|uniref:Chloride channel protein n=1 Tax=Pseudolysobacter antarcticus TaxID=2511995 RepID=A0A411HIH1_9GAMM|nr:chloride channel protein [Pseudolysobacter antarcticus]QBB70197.1 chloride channel protein [Pseudolysobacter antarcticus]
MENRANLPIDDHHALLSTQHWKRRAALWSGAIAVALAAIIFAKGGDLCYQLFERLLANSRYWPLLVTPLGFAILAWLTEGALRATRGSGIPQVIAAVNPEVDAPFRERLLALPIAAGKLVLTLFAMLVGASIGREGPTVHVGAGLMVWLAQRFGFRDAQSISRFALAGGAAGIAAAFNTPLAGVMFAIEELAGAFEHRFSGALLTAVMIGGVVSLGLVGDYAYFGKMTISLPLGESWIAVLVTGIVGGLAGGLFARTILSIASNLPGILGRFRRVSPIGFAAVCGLVLALLGLASHGSVFGTGYAQAREIISGSHAITAWFGVDKWLANVVSSAAGIPGGIFSPALAVGAGLGANLAPLLPHTDPTAVILLGMAAYLAGVTQAPLTSAVISMELTDNHDFVLPIMAACVLGRTFSTLFCKTPIYRALAEQVSRDHAMRHGVPGVENEAK